MQHKTIKFMGIAFAGLLALNVTAMQPTEDKKQCTPTQIDAAYEVVKNNYNEIEANITKKFLLISACLRSKYPEQQQIFHRTYNEKTIQPFLRAQSSLELSRQPSNSITDEEKYNSVQQAYMNRSQTLDAVVAAKRQHDSINRQHPELNLEYWSSNQPSIPLQLDLLYIGQRLNEDSQGTFNENKIKSWNLSLVPLDKDLAEKIDAYNKLWAE